MRKFATLLLIAALIMAANSKRDFGETMYSSKTSEDADTKYTYVADTMTEEELIANSKGVLKREEVLPGRHFKGDFQATDVEDCFKEAVNIAQKQAESAEDDLTKLYMNSFVDWLGEVEEAKEVTDGIIEEAAEKIHESIEQNPQ